MNDDELFLEVTGSSCLADVLQGLSRARLACPPRFLFQLSGERMSSTWKKGGSRISLTWLGEADPAVIENLPDEELFKIEEDFT